MKFIAILTIGCMLFAACTGARGHMKFSDLRYPASMSASLYNRNEAVLVKDKNLKVVEKFSYEKRFWGILYSWVRLSGSGDVDSAMNEAIAKAHGDGIVNVRVTEASCSFNTYMAIPFTLIPLTPGCVNAKVEGEIVKVR